MLTRVNSWELKFRISIRGAQAAHYLALVVVFGWTILACLWAFYSDSRDRSDDLRGVLLLIAPLSLIEIITLVSGLWLLTHHSRSITLLHRITAPVTLLVGGLWSLVGVIFGAPVVFATWIALNKERVVQRR